VPKEAVPWNQIVLTMVNFCINHSFTGLTLLLGFFIEPTLKGKPTTSSLLAKRLRQKEEHEHARNKRHKERMEMNNKLLALFDKVIEKQ